MPTVTIHNETDSTLHIAMIAGVPRHFDNNVPPGEAFRREWVSSIPWGYEARIPDGMNQYSAGDSWGRVGCMAGAVAAGTSSVVLGTASVLGTFASRWSLAGLTGAGYLMDAAHKGGAAFATPGSGVVMRKDWWMVGMQDLTYAIRVVNGHYDLVEV